MSPERAEEVQREGITKVYPGYLTQISLYGRRLKEMNLVSHAERGIFGMMDREGRLLPPERVVWERREVDRTPSADSPRWWRPPGRARWWTGPTPRAPPSAGTATTIPTAGGLTRSRRRPWRGGGRPARSRWSSRPPGRGRS